MPEHPSITIYRCDACSAAYPQAHAACKRCAGTRFTEEESGGAGTLVTWTRIRKPPTAFAQQAPYAVAVVELDEGVRVTGRLADDATEPPLGTRVELAGMTAGLPVFR